MVYGGFEPQVDVCDNPTLQRKTKLGNVKLSASNFDSTRDSCVFGGINDDLVIAGSGQGWDSNLYIWALPDYKDQDLFVRKPLHVLPAHDKTSINCVRYSNNATAIISAFRNGVIKLWTLQSSPTYNID